MRRLKDQLLDIIHTENGKEYTTDDAEKVRAGATKYDGGKIPVFRGAIGYFPTALKAVAEISYFGARKYAWAGWRGVDDGINRYTDGLMRHLLAEAEGETRDPDSELLHAAHTAWNALARLELIIEEQKKNGETNTTG